MMSCLKSWSEFLQLAKTKDDFSESEYFVSLTLRYKVRFILKICIFVTETINVFHIEMFVFVFSQVRNLQPSEVT